MTVFVVLESADTYLLLHGPGPSSEESREGHSIAWWSKAVVGGESKILHGGVHGGDLVETLWSAKSGQKLTGRPILPSMATCHSF